MERARGVREVMGSILSHTLRVMFTNSPFIYLFIYFISFILVVFAEILLSQAKCFYALFLDRVKTDTEIQTRKASKTQPPQKRQQTVGTFLHDH